MGFWKSLGYLLMLIGGLLLVAFEYFLATPIKAQTAVLQLEDSNVLYSLGEKAATSGINTVIFVTGLVLIAISVYKLITGKDKKDEIND